MLAVCLLAAAGLAGCATRLSADPNRETEPCVPIREEIWPARDQAWADAATHDQPREIGWFVRADGSVADGVHELGEWMDRDFENLFILARLGKPRGRVEFSRRVGTGIVRGIVEQPHPTLAKYLTPHRLRYQTFVCRHSDGLCLSDGLAPLYRAYADQFAADGQAMEAVAAAGLRMDRERGLALHEGMPFYVDPPWIHSDGFVRPNGVGTRGVLFYVLGVSGAFAKDEPLFDEIARRGWRIVLLPTGRIRPAPPKPFLIENDSPETIDAAGAAIAGHIDDRLAELSYAVEAAAEYLSESHPELNGKPVAVLGYSAGAIAAPAIAARLKQRMPDRLAALVLVCGGSDAMGMAYNSIVIGSRYYAKWRGHPPHDADWRLREAYLRHSRLDPAAVGPAVRDVPTLIVKAKIDWAVPGSATDRLYYDLGKPDWWSYLAGHISVLERLAEDRVRFADWLDAAAERGAQPRPTAEGLTPPAAAAPATRSRS